MLKKATLLLLLVLLVCNTALFATTSTLASSSFSIPIINDCIPIDNTTLRVSNESDTYVYVYSPSTLSGVDNQFRYRPVGTSLWLFSSIRLTYYRFLRNLQPGTLYEFQVSYKCTDSLWSAFSDSHIFRTTGNSLVEEEIVETMDSTLVDSVQTDTVVMDSTMLEIDTMEIDTVDMDIMMTDSTMLKIDTMDIDTVDMDVMMTDSTMLEMDTMDIDTVDMDVTMTDSIMLAIDTMDIDTVTMDTLVLTDTDSLKLDSMDILDADTSSTAAILINNTILNCGDSLLCVSVVGSNLDAVTNIQFTLSWDTTIVQLVSIAPNEEMMDTSILSNLDATMLMAGIFPYIWNKTDSLISTLPTNDHLFTLCFSPLKSGSAEIQFIDSLPLYALQMNDSLAIDTIKELSFQTGTITIDDCEGKQLGGGTCSPPSASGLTTSSKSENATYIQASLRGQVVNNQFRYREAGAQAWVYTPIDSVHFRYLKDLTEGTTYEFQVTLQCPDSTYSDYSSSFTFTTLGEIVNTNASNSDTDNTTPIISSSCEPVSYDALGVSTIKQFFAYIYTDQPYGPIDNQFRYRVVGRTFWLYTSIAATYYRYLMGLEDGQLYEYQVSHECEPGVWSPFSVSYMFETLPSINFGSESISRLTNNVGVIAGAPFQVFPNPATRELTVTLGQALSNDGQLTVLNLQGQVVKKGKMVVGQKQAILDVEDLLSGLYIVRLESGTRKEMHKFIKQ